MNLTDKIYIAGHAGMVGSAIWRALSKAGYSNLIGKTIDELDLCDQRSVNDFFESEKPDYVFLAAAKVGGILVNEKFRADFIYTNLAIQNNVIHAAYKTGVKKLMFLGSSCIYPRECPQPIKESYLMTGPLEPTNEPYAIAKIAGLKMCESYHRQHGADFVSAMPTNLYGPNDNFDLKTSHVLPAMVRKFIEAKENNLSDVTIWGSGRAKREFLYVEDAAEALIFLMRLDSSIYDKLGVTHINVGTGEDVTIAELAEAIREIVGYKGSIKYDASKPDGMPRKLLDVSLISELGWKSKTTLHKGIEKTRDWYLNNRPQ